MRYLITGHTGFKGAWLSLWLLQQGHEVHGLALNPDPGSLFETASISSRLESDSRVDVRNADQVIELMSEISPEIVIHMAAQPLVRVSYLDPRWTLETNVMGTLNVLEASQVTDSIRAQLIVTTDKVYRNVNQIEGYHEGAALGGDDPYSASKAMADILSQSWIKSFGGPPTAIARAGNVVGGGDVSRDRLFPDIVKALATDESPILRYPAAVRPWQHVLDCLNAYLTLVDSLVCGDAAVPSGSAWNFGPDSSSFVSVGEVATLAARCWGSNRAWVTTDEPQPHEANLLALDARKAMQQLNLRNRLNFDLTIGWTVDWYKQVAGGADPLSVTMDQIEKFQALQVK